MGKAKAMAIQPKRNQLSEKEAVKSAINPNINGPTIAPEAAKKFSKPEAAPMTDRGSHSDKSEGPIDHIIEKKMMRVNKATA